MTFSTKKLGVLLFVILAALSSNKLKAQVLSVGYNFVPNLICTNVPVTFTSNVSGTKIASYNWTFGAGASTLSFNGKIPPQITYSTSGLKNVTLTITDSLGNTLSNGNTILIQTTTANAGLDVSICSSSSATIGSASQPGFTYNWTPSIGLSNATSANPIANPTTTTTYTLTANDPNGCSAVGQVVVTNIGILKADAGKDISICFGNSTTLGSASSAGFNYTWFPSSSLSSAIISNPTASPTITTTYNLLVAAGGCTALDTVIVTVLSNPLLPSNDTIAKCALAVVSIGTNIPTGLTYNWSPALNLSSTNIANPSSNIQSDIIYTLTATNSSNCSSSKIVLVDVYDPIQAFAGLDQVVCDGNGILLGGSPNVAVGGSGSYVYSWKPNSQISALNVAHPNATPKVTTTYVLTVTDALGSACGSSTDSIVLTILPLPHPVITMPTIYCEGSAPITMQGLPAGGYFSGTGVIFGTTFNAADSAIVFGVPFPITYTYSSGVCIYDTSISVVVFQNPVADAGLDKTICTNLGQSATTIIATGGTSYSWTPTIGLQAPNAAATLASPTSNTTYKVAVTLNGCVSYDSVIVTLSVNCGVDSIIIANDDYVQLPSNVTSKIGYLLNDDLIDGKTPLNTIIQKGASHGFASINANHVLSYTPNLNYIGFDTLIYLICDSVNAPVSNKYLCDTAIVFIAVGPNVLDDNYIVRCNDSLFFNPLINDNYGNGLYPITLTMVDSANHGLVIWSNNSIKYVPDFGFSGTDTIIYQVCVNGFCSSASIYLHVTCQLLPIAVDDYISVQGGTANSIKMLNNDTTNGSVTIAVITNPAHGTFTINEKTQTIIYTPADGYLGNDKIQYVICNNIGCDTAWIYLAVEDSSPCQLSSGFSPNGDGVNDFYTVNCAHNFNTSRLTIFNRWGNTIYSRKGNTDASNSWDGKYNGLELPDGTYYYIFEAYENDKKPKTGFIELKR